jgi:hypothetical protein
MDHDEFDMIGIANTNIHLLDVSGVTSWDGESTKIENHGIEVEYMITDRVENMEYIGFKVRRLNGTHEEMGTVVLCPEERTTHQYYVVYTIKGINVHGIEFDMP